MHDLCVALIDYYAVHMIFLPRSVRSRNDLLLNGTYLFPAPRAGTAPSPSCPVYDDGNTFLEFNCEFEPGRMRQHYLLIWREIPISGGSRIVSGSGLTGFSADTDDFSLRVDLSVVKDIGSFFCRVEVPKCVKSLSSPDNISGSCAKSILPGMEQKVPPNYCELVSVKLACERCGVSHSAVTRGYVCVYLTPSPSLPPLPSLHLSLTSSLTSSPSANLLSTQPLIPTSAMEGVPVNISCTANTTGFQDITFEWTVGQGLPILCNNNSNCSTEGGVSVLRRAYSEGQIDVSCTVHATDSTGTGGCVKTTRRSSLTVEGERGDPSNHNGCAMVSYA